MINTTKRVLFSIVLLFLTFGVSSASDSKRDYFRRHFYIVVDQTPDVQNSNAIGDVFKRLSAELKNKDGALGFDPATDELSLYAFGMDGAGNNPSNTTAFSKVHSACRYGAFTDEEVYKLFVNELVLHRGDLSASNLGVDKFVDSKLRSLFFSKDKRAKDIAQNSGVTLSKFVYEAMLEHMRSNGKDNNLPSVEDILIIVTNYKSGIYDMGTSADISVARDLLGSRYQKIDSYFKNVSKPFYKVSIDYEEFGNDIDVKPVIDVQQINLKSLKGVNPFMSSNLNVSQKSFGSNIFNIEDVGVVFDHGEDLKIDKVMLEVSDEENSGYTKQNIDNYRYDKSKREYTFPAGSVVLNDDFGKRLGDKLKFNYVFYAMVNGMPKVFQVTRELELGEENIISLTEDKTTRTIAIVIFLALAAILVLLGWLIYKKRGLKVKANVKIDIRPVSKERFLRVKDNVVTNLDCWYWDGIYGNRPIAVHLNLSKTKLSFAKEYEYELFARVQDMDANYDFTFRPSPAYHISPQGGMYAVGQWVPIKLDANGCGSFVVDAYFDSANAEGATPNFEHDNILKMGVSVCLKRKVDGKEQYVLLQNGVQEVSEQYDFIVRPKMENSNLWVAFDPGTSGSCVAFGNATTPTTKNDLFIAKNSAETLKGTTTFSSIFPSVIRIIGSSKALASDSPIDASSLVEGVDFDFGNNALMIEGNFNRFQSIKKLLGYDINQKIVLSKGTSREQTKEIAGKDLAHLVVKGICNHFDKYILEEADASVKEQFVVGDRVGVERAIVAVPNSYTLDKIQDMVDSVARTNRFKEVHYIYESEAVFMTYLRDNWARLGVLQNDKIFIVYDMGGATINITAFKLKVDLDASNNVDRVYVTTISKIGYTIGGDDIDYALIQMIYGLPTVKSALKALQKEKGDQSKYDEFEFKHQQIYKDKLIKFVRAIKLDIIDKRLGADNVSGIQDAETLYGHIVNLFSQFGIVLDVFNEKVQRYLASQDKKCHAMDFYVMNQVDDAVNELLSLLSANESKNLELIFSGRSVLYPRVKETVKARIAQYNYQVNEWDGLKVNGVESAELVKTAVAKGACWFGMYNSTIRLDHSILTTTLGYIDEQGGEQTFVPLLKAGSHFDRNGELKSESVQPIFAHLGHVEFVQMMGVDYDRIWREGLSHKYSILAQVRRNQIIGDVQSIKIEANDCCEVECKVKHNPGEINVKSGDMRLDITNDNSRAYIFATTNINAETKAAGGEVELVEKKVLKSASKVRI